MTEIEITDEMMVAGREAFYLWSDPGSDPQYLIRDVYERMRRLEPLTNLPEESRAE